MKKAISFVMSIVMLITCFTGFQMTALADDNLPELSINQSKTSGRFTATDKLKSYYINIPADGKFSFNMTSYTYKINYTLWDVNRAKKLREEEIWYASEDSPQTKVCDNVLTAGKYRLEISGDEGRYTIWTNYENYNVTDTVAISYDNPQIVPENQTITCASTATKNYDWFKIIIPNTNAYMFKLTTYADRTNFHLYNSDLSKTITEQSYWYATESEPKTGIINLSLTAGTYFLKTTSEQGKYLFSWATLTKDNCKHEFESSWVSATYFSKGYTLNKCKNCGYSYKSNYTSKLTVSKPNIYSIARGKKKLAVTFENTYDIDGIQIKYSTNKKFPSSSTKTVSTTNKSSKVLKKLKGKKKYYVRIRGFKKINGKKAYSAWSNRVSAKTK